MTATPSPNILLILADDMGWSDLGCYGGEIETPNLDSLAASGRRWSQFYNNARCCPSRASLLTGAYPHRVGVGLMDRDEGQPGYQGFIAPNAVTLAEALGSGGYATFMSGKWHVGAGKGHEPHHRGFDSWYGCLQGGVYWYPSRHLSREIARDGKEEAPADPEWFSTDAFTDAAIDYIRRAHAEGRPFFSYLPYIAPHFPLQAKPKDIEKYRGRYSGGWQPVAERRMEKLRGLDLLPDSFLQHREIEGWENLAPAEKELSSRKMEIYAAQVDNLDQNVGRLLEVLDELDISDNTIVIFLSDNGASGEGGEPGYDKLGTHDLGGPDSFSSYGSKWAQVGNTPFGGMKMNNWEGGVRTPFIIRWPEGLGTEPGIVRAPGHLMDLMPTLLGIAGIDPPATWNGEPALSLDGLDLRPALQGGPMDERKLYWEHLGSRAARHGQWKIVGRDDDLRLFDMERDPTELSPLCEPARGDRMAESWRRWAEENKVFPKPDAIDS